ncbi:MAG: type II toxin-antitoxin system Phd/YefM family antitoxin [Alphaproteobacteria bacterium]|jgi:prevent-host-death family protein|nr:type II toxin-antitoxin system Phd/YefM family antitoxin [Alphaproteobacteria bacterium]MDP6563567.1 type II toxin-antitoxin system Phd/YefM family antitoxin [Alphaproteobacteria bacterium]MDP6814994.1 type II toxin-antitoxin system Phd/YefM family antitoxin [Alphaproteobacteria bacterium]
MKTISANELKQATGQMMDHAQRGPVVVEKYGRPYAVLLSHEDYQLYEKTKYAALKAGIEAGIESGDAGAFDPDALVAEIERDLRAQQNE